MPNEKRKQAVLANWEFVDPTWAGKWVFL